MYPLIHKQNIYKNEFEIYETQHIEYNDSLLKPFFHVHFYLK